MVRAHTWTMDKFVSMAKQVSSDLNGDLKFDQNDLYGMCVWQDGMLFATNAAGGRIGKINENGEIELTLNTEQASICHEIYELSYDRSVALFTIREHRKHVRKRPGAVL